MKNKIKNVILHIPDNINENSFSNEVNELYVRAIERYLNQSNLTTEEKVIVIDKIIEQLKLSGIT